MPRKTASKSTVVPRKKPANAKPSPTTRAAAAAAAEKEFPTRESFGYLVREINRRIAQAHQSIIAPYGLTLGMWFFLRSLWDEDGITQRELCTRIRMTEPTAVIALKAMERRGIIHRVRDKVDARKYYIFLTPEGSELKSKVLPRVAEANTKIFLKGLPRKEAEQLLATLHRVLANVSDL
jgi:DNA-binding MarR family transcriptional regulator